MIARATASDEPDPTGSVTRLLLGVLLGLVLGVGAAALLETLRPTIVGAEPLAREFRTPVLGSLTPELNEAEVERLARTIGIAAVATDAAAVVLLPVGDDVDLGSLRNRLNQTLYADAAADTASRSTPYITELHEQQSPEIDRVAAVLVSPTRIRKSVATATHHFLDATRIPVVGLVTYEPERRNLFRRLQHEAFAWSQS